MSCDLEDAAGQAVDARDDARAIGDPVFEAAALACAALARRGGRHPTPARGIDAAAAALERLSPAQLATRLPAFWMIARARRALGQLAPALADLERGAAIAAETGRENVLVQLTIETAVTLVELGRLEEAIAAAEQGLELALLAANPRVLLWAHCTLSAARLAAGDVAAALHHADGRGRVRRAARLPRRRPARLVPGRGVDSGGNPERAVAAMLDSFGASLDAVLPVDRPAAAADLAAAQLAARRPGRGRARALGEEAAGRPTASTGVVAPRSARAGARARGARGGGDARAAAGGPRSWPRGRSSRRAARSPRPAGARGGRGADRRGVPASPASARRACATRRRASCAGSATASTVPRGRPTPG